MNKDQLRKIVGFRVRLVPIAHRFDDRGLPLPQNDYEWIVQEVTDEGVQLSLPPTGHCRVIGFDNVHHFSTDRKLAGITYGVLTLNVQLSIYRHEIHLTPTRPGEPVAPKMRPDPIRAALLRRLYERPTAFVMPGDLQPFQHADVVGEIARCAAEELIEARLLRDGNSVAEAVALRLRPRGVEWLRHNGF